MRSQEAAPALINHEDKLDKILETIETTGQDLHNRVDAVVEVTLLQEDRKKLSTRVTSMKSDLRDLRTCKRRTALGWEFWVLVQAAIKFKEDARQVQAQT
ncbi:hypothetical protein NDU88_006234 [Pleurodeles waltl]|uniref:Uncharacterized protein n=1 Tax=Pleurodeles waltl TaxID=8319 RepID=A0AAV7UND2_PLEWA|nr:hypothetical protein NDU88_006234 [Pleurodeles waltl]